MFKKFFSKLNPMTAIQNWAIKHFAKKVIKAFPDLKEEGVKIIEKYANELFNKIQITVIQFVEGNKDKSK